MSEELTVNGMLQNLQERVCRLERIEAGVEASNIPVDSLPEIVTAKEINAEFSEIQTKAVPEAVCLICGDRALKDYLQEVRRQARVRKRQYRKRDKS